MLALNASNANAAQATGTAKAEILTAGQIQATKELDFGRILNTEQQIVTVDVNGSRTSTKEALLVGSAASAGQFLVQGTNDTNVTIDVPRTITLTNTKSSSSKLTVNNVTFKLGTIEGSGGTTKTGKFSGTAVATGSTEAQETMYVGGQLEVPAGQTGGSYSGTYTVTLTY